MSAEPSDSHMEKTLLSMERHLQKIKRSFKETAKDRTEKTVQLPACMN